MSMQYKETQRIHESKKKEKEADKLKLKLAQVLTSLICTFDETVAWLRVYVCMCYCS